MFWGTIHYRDTFQNWHYTNYCYSFLVRQRLYMMRHAQNITMLISLVKLARLTPKSHWGAPRRRFSRIDLLS
jgi:hypothetical protein